MVTGSMVIRPTVGAGAALLSAILAGFVVEPGLGGLPLPVGFALVVHRSWSECPVLRAGNRCATGVAGRGRRPRDDQGRPAGHSARWCGGGGLVPGARVRPW